MSKENEILPSWVPHIIAYVFLISLILLYIQYIQDHFRQKELVETQRIGLYHQQAEVFGHLVNATLTGASDEIQETINKLEQTQQQQTILAEQISALDNSDTRLEDEAGITKLVASSIVETKELLVDSLDGKWLDTARLQDYYLQYLDKKAQLISQLTAQLYADSQYHRKIEWWLTFFAMALVFVVSLAIYWRGKRAVDQQFSQLKQLKDQLQQEKDQAHKALQDLSEEVALRKQQQGKLNAILDSAVDGIITITGEGIIDSFNKAAVTMFGYPAESVIGKNINMLMPEPYSSKHDGYLQHYHQTGEKKVIGHIREVVGRRIDGSEFPLRLSVGEVHYGDTKLFTGIIRDISERKKTEQKLRNTLAELTRKQAEIEEEERIAHHVFNTITASNNPVIPEVECWCEPMGSFSGDMMLSALLPSGGVRVLLCDFTGHGLPAALGAVPVSTIHSAMAQKGLPLEVLMNELNEKLNELLPTGIFCCIAGIDLDKTRTQAQIWNAGLPDVLVVNKSGDITHRISSAHLPVGVTAYLKSELHCQTVNLQQGDAVYVLSDGLTEAENESGEQFGQQRFEQLLRVELGGHGRLDEIRNSVGEFMGHAAATDDISLIEIKIVSTTD